jgi:hypothetical protein
VTDKELEQWEKAKATLDEITRGSEERIRMARAIAISHMLHGTELPGWDDPLPEGMVRVRGEDGREWVVDTSSKPIPEEAITKLREAWRKMVDPNAAWRKRADPKDGDA